jgi:phosphate transport system protein
MASFQSGNIEQAKGVIEQDNEVNSSEVVLDEACRHLIVKRQPTANDLRSVMSTVKIISDLERIGDEASKIARAAIHIHEAGGVNLNHVGAVRSLAHRTSVLLHDALDSLARFDKKEAIQVITQDTEVDRECRLVLRSLVTFMMEDPRTISTILDTIWVVKAIERIGDHAKNIAEYVVFIVEGKDIRHTDYAITHQND